MRLRLSLSVLRRTSTSIDEAASNTQASAAQGPAQRAGQAQPNRSRSRERNPMLGGIAAGVRDSQTAAAAPAPRNARPSQSIVIREPSSEAVPALRAVSGKGKAPMFAEDAPMLGRIEANVIGTREKGATGASTSGTQAESYRLHPGGGSSLAMLLGIEPLGAPRLGPAGLRLARTRPAVEGTKKADALLMQIESVASHHDSGQAEAPTGGSAELGMRLAHGDTAALAPLLALIARALSGAKGAAETSAAGAMAAVVLSAEGMQALTERLQEAHSRLDELELALDFAPDDGEAVARARAQVEAARAALDAVQADALHCKLQRSIDTHDLLPEAAVIGELGMLSTLRLAMLPSNDGTRESLAQEASRLADDLHALMDASLDGERAVLSEAGGPAASASTVLAAAAKRVTELYGDVTAGPARDALAKLSRALASTQAWLAADARGDERLADVAVPIVPALASSFRTAIAADAATTAEHISELTRQRASLGQLPKLAARVRAELPSGVSEAEYHRTLNDAIANEILHSLGPHTPIDTRIELARVAMHFGAGNPVELQRLGRMLTSAALAIERPSAEQVRKTLGARDSAARVRALYDRLGDIAADLTPAEAERFDRTLDRTWILRSAPAQATLLRNAARAIVSGQRPEAFSEGQQIRLPDDPEWLASILQRWNIVCAYLNQCSGARLADRRSATEGVVDNRTPFRQILALASNMEALRGHRHHFISFAKELLAADEERIENGHRPAIESAQVYELLHLLIAQLPTFGTASGDRQTVADVMTFVLQQLKKDHLLEHHKARLAKELIDVTGHLATSRHSASDAHQSHALDAIIAGLKHLHGEPLASLLQQLVVSRDGWSDERSAHGRLPRSRGQKRNMAFSAALPPYSVAVSLAWGAAVGRSSPKSKAIVVALEALERDVARSLRRGETQSAAFLPLYRELLSSLSANHAQGNAKADKAHLARVQACIVLGTLPAEIDAQQRNSHISQALGDDPAVRAALAKMLIAAVSERKGVASKPLARIHAARYLQNLLASGTHGLSEAEREAAQAAIGRAAGSKSANWTDRKQLAVLLAMIREATRDGMPIRQEVANIAASNMMSALRPRRALEDAREVASMVPPLLQLYPLLDAGTRAQFRTALENIAPAVPENMGAAARNQLPLLSLATSLARFKGSAEDAAQLTGLLKSVWPRLNGTNQQAALNDMFDAYDEATPEGRNALLSVVAELEDEGQFVSAAIRLVDNALPSTATETASSDTQAHSVIDTVLNRMGDLSGPALSDLASNIVRDGGRARQPLIDGFLAAADRLEPRALAAVLSVELSRLGTLPAAEIEAAVARWHEIADGMDDGKAAQRDTLRLFAAVASQGHIDADANRTNEDTAAAIAVPADAASQLLAALPTLSNRMQPVVLRYIAGEGAPADVRKSIVDSLFRDFAAADAGRRALAIELGGPAAVGRALEALASIFGVPQSHDGKVVTRPDLDQPFLASGGPDGSLKTLRSALMAPQRRPQEIAVALEAMAERFQALPLAYQGQFRDLFNERGRQLPDDLRGRVINTLALANPSLAENNDFSEIGRALLSAHHTDGVPGIAAARLRGGRIKNADAALAALRRTRLSMPNHTQGA
jgi:hypothetical protein